MKKQRSTADDHERLMDAVGLLAGGIAHEFNNLLTAIQGYVDLLDDKSEANASREADLNEIRLATRRAAALTRQLLAFSRKQFLTPTLLRTADVVTAIMPMLTRQRGDGVELKATTSGRGVVLADEGQLEQVLLNLVANARDAIADVGSITIETRDVVLDKSHPAWHPGVAVGPYALIAVTDTGRGMDAETQSRVFEPFFTTKETEGTGLGLATVYGIVKQSNGLITVDSEVGRGTTFAIYLPLHEDPATLDSAAGVHGSAGRILVVEDEKMVRELVSRTLDRAGYTVIATGNPLEALAIANREPAPLDLLITDVILPEMQGPALAEELQRRQPGCRILYMSGYTANALVREGEHGRAMEFLQKPFSLDALRNKVREILQSRQQ
jgi:CheY-like chemotaxis protein